jgi:hypothetical protein
LQNALQLPADGSDRRNARHMQFPAIAGRRNEAKADDRKRRPKNPINEKPPGSPGGLMKINKRTMNVFFGFERF